MLIGTPTRSLAELVDIVRRRDGDETALIRIVRSATPGPENDNSEGERYEGCHTQFV